MSSGNWEKHPFLLGGSESPAQGHLLSWEGAGLSASSCLGCALAFPGIVRAGPDTWVWAGRRQRRSSTCTLLSGQPH